MDEPLSNLDAKLRVAMRAELARLHDRLGVTTVYVTHDQVEAMTLGQRVAVLRDGRAAAVRHAADAVPRPGEPVRRRVHGLAVDERRRGRRCATAASRSPGSSLPLPPESPLADGPRDVILGIRPTDLRHAVGRARRASPGSACGPTWSRSSAASRTCSSRSRRRGCRPTPRVRRSRLRPTTTRRCSPTTAAPGSARRLDGRRPVVLGEERRARRRPPASALLRPRDGAMSISAAAHSAAAGEPAAQRAAPARAASPGRRHRRRPSVS